MKILTRSSCVSLLYRVSAACSMQVYSDSENDRGTTSGNLDVEKNGL